MAMTVVVTRNVPMRIRGFLASCLLEVTPGVYTHPRLSKAVRERIWAVLQGWFTGGESSILLLYADNREESGLGVQTLGDPPRKLVDADGVILSQGNLTKELDEL
jgi:CRISPR-associated protein Cas2